MSTLLKVEGIDSHYGAIHALHGVSLEVPEGSIVSVLGANGAGKSTTLRSISGTVRISQGAITFLGQRIDRLPPEQIARLGIAHIPEGRGIFSDLTVLQNLQLGAAMQKDKRQRERDYERVWKYFPVLYEKRKQNAATLSGGQQQMVAIGRALLSGPRLLMIDELSFGLSPILTGEMFNLVQQINAEGTTVLLVEQNVGHALRVSQYGYVLTTGHVTLQDTASNLLGNDKVIHSYLGG